MTYKIGLVTPSSQSHRTAEESLSLGYLGAVLRTNGYEVCIVDGWLESLSAENIVERLSTDANPSIVGVSCYRSNIEQAVEVLAAVQRRFGHIPVICGGYGPTFHEQLFLERGFTAVVLGEAEHIIVSLVQALLSGHGIENVAGVSFKKSNQVIQIPRSEPVIELDNLPFPIRDSIKTTVEQRNFVHICTSRGCEGHCSFCSIFSFARGAPGQQRWRHRSAVNVVDELRYIYEHYGVTHFKFVDDSFLEPPRDTHWVERFQQEIGKKSLSIKFRTQVRADRINADIVRILKDAGWFSTSVGVENFSATALKRMGKSASITDNLLAIKLLSRESIYTQMGMILFDPYTTLPELFENLKFLKMYRWPVTKGIFTEMYAAEGTIFSKKLVLQGLLQDDPIMQNHRYQVNDLYARRVYVMLKDWHRSHSMVYDWVIDSLTAPKVLDDRDYEKVYLLYQILQSLDLNFFEKVLARVIQTNEIGRDSMFVQESIAQHYDVYILVEKKIEEIYRNNKLYYKAISNPFLSSN